MALQLRTEWYMHIIKLQGKTHIKGMKETISRAHRELRIVPVPINEIRTPGTIGEILRKILHHDWAKVSSRYTLLWCYPTKLKRHP